MSKKKKTIEELLEEAILLDEEQSYEVPRNWVWTRVENAIKPMETREPKKLDGEVFHYIDVDAIDNKKQSVRQVKEVEITLAPSRAKRKVSKDDVIISLVRPYLKNIAHIDIDDNKLVASTAFYVCTPKEILDSNYLYSYLCSNYATQYLIDHTRGDNSPSVRSTDYEKMPLPLPPVNEQKRIVEKVERLLSKIEEAKQLIEEAKETFELRRAAILDKAFRGELTAKWREENKEVIDAIDFIRMIDEKRRNNLLPKEKPNYLSYIFEKCVSKIEELPSSWVQAPVGFMCDCIVPGRDKPKSFTGDIPWITIPDIKQDYLNKSNASFYLNEEEIKEVKAKVIPSNSVVMSCVGRFGVSAIVNTPLVINQQLHAFLPSEMINPKYLMYQIRTLVSYMNKKATSTTISYLNKTNANSLPINVPPIEEQKKIVEILDNYFERDSNALNLIENQLEQIAQIKTSILAKAFRGELGTNDPNEERAIELLKEVLQEQVK
ncbi:restriction endonuclease subunit S [Bacillus amyloliquefaciens]|uniref:restriction endonuclease subunit S n=1 Tax=Bacillus amyloliquefaciens TaxID=1390 RepID=UPI000824893B|nr:restriction endonuclease subunit S [Bacillus amyloliquefaciens]AOC91964.1 Type I site-specific deoxyribonuclease [Bacillus amyloliquefaciens]RDY89448.1 hypothetical protein C3733_12270 [Bacillus amyloliquefaciens]